MEKYSTLLLAAAGAWLYFTGWAYLYSFYGFFNINMIEVDPSVQFVFMHSLSPWYFWYSWLADFLTLKGIILVAALYVVLVAAISSVFKMRTVTKRVDRFIKWTRSSSTRLRPYLSVDLISVTVVVILLIVSLLASRSAGAHRAEEIWSDPGIIAYFNFKADTLQSPAEPKFSDRTRTFNDKLEMKYLFSTEKFHYAFVREDECPSPPCAGIVFKMPVDMIEEVLLLRD